jgi:AAA domain
MASFENYQKVSFVKGLYLGDAGSGKTTSLVSLIEAGLKVRVYDFDNLLTPLYHAIQRKCPDKLKNLSYQVFTDKMKGSDTPGMMQGNVLKVMPMVDGQATAFSSALKQLNRWKDGDEDLGVPAQWGKDCVVVIDTLTTMATAAFRYCEALNPLAKEPQATYFAAQRMVSNVLALLASESFATNVLVLAHLDYDKNQLDITKGFPRAIGSAMRTQISPFFSCVLLAEDQKWIKTRSTGIVDLKNPVSFKVDEKLPLDTGLATFFQAVTA